MYGGSFLQSHLFIDSKAIHYLETILNPEYALANLLRHPNPSATFASLHFAPSPLRYYASFAKCLWLGPLNAHYNFLMYNPG
jgi:hypothetical protein